MERKMTDDEMDASVAMAVSALESVTLRSFAGQQVGMRGDWHLIQGVTMMRCKVALVFVRELAEELGICVGTLEDIAEAQNARDAGEGRG